MRHDPDRCRHDKAGEQAATKTYILGTVSGVELDGPEPRLIIGDEATGNKKVALSDLSEVLN